LAESLSPRTIWGGLKFAMLRRSLAGGSDTAVVANRAGSCMVAA
jgi:hypothetical protein